MKKINIVEIDYSLLKNYKCHFFIDPDILREIYLNDLYYYAGFQDNKLIFIFQFYEEKKLFFKRLIPPPFLPYNDLFLNFDKNLPNYKIHDYNKSIVEALAHFLIKKSKYGIVNLSFSPQINDLQSFFWNKIKVIPNYTYQINLNATVEEIVENFSSKKKSLIKKALNDGLSFKEDTLENLNKMIYLTFLRKKLLKKWNLYQKFAQTLEKYQLLKIFSAYYNDKLLGTCAFLVKEQNVYFLFSGHNTENQHPSSITFILYNAILFFKQSGAKIFDFEGSMIKEVEREFRQFGGLLIPYYTINHAPILIELFLKFNYKNRF